MLTTMISIPICCEALSLVVPKNRLKILIPSRNWCRHPPEPISREVNTVPRTNVLRLSNPYSFGGPKNLGIDAGCFGKFHTLTDFPLEFEFYTHELDNRIRPKLTDVLHVSRPFGRCDPVPIGPSSARSFTGKSIQSTPQRHRANTALTRHVFFIGIDKNPLRNFQLFGSTMEAARDFG